MSNLNDFSAPLELPNIPEGSGVCILQDEQGQVLQVVMSNNIRRRIGELLDSQGTICVHGPKIYRAQQEGKRILVRWKLMPDYKAEKRQPLEELNPLWGPWHRAH